MALRHTLDEASASAVWEVEEENPLEGLCCCSPCSVRGELTDKHCLHTNQLRQQHGCHNRTVRKKLHHGRRGDHRQRPSHVKVSATLLPIAVRPSPAMSSGRGHTRWQSKTATHHRTDHRWNQSLPRDRQNQPWFHDDVRMQRLMCNQLEQNFAKRCNTTKRIAQTIRLCEISGQKKRHTAAFHSKSKNCTPLKQNGLWEWFGPSNV